MKHRIKKIIIISVAAVALITCAALCFAYRDYLSATTRRINIDKTVTAQSVMTFNVRNLSPTESSESNWLRRAPAICDMLQKTLPSIICMQENNGLQYRFFKRFLKGYDSVAEKRDPAVISEYLPVFFRSDMYESEQTGTFWLSDTPDVMSNTWDSAYFRICTYVVLKNKRTNKKFIVGNAHLDYKSLETRIKSIQLIYDRLSVFNLPSIVAGDFNCEPGSKTMKFAKRYYIDAGQGFEDENKGTFNGFKNDCPNEKVDYILQTPGSFTVKNYKVVDKRYSDIFVSDHFPVYAEME